MLLDDINLKAIIMVAYMRASNLFFNSILSLTYMLYAYYNCKNYVLVSHLLWDQFYQNWSPSLDKSVRTS